jgi:hypothetical protein
VFDAGPGRPPLPILLAIVGPLIRFAVLYRASAAFQRFVLASICGSSPRCRAGA